MFRFVCSVGLSLQAEILHRRQDSATLGDSGLRFLVAGAVDWDYETVGQMVGTV